MITNRYKAVYERGKPEHSPYDDFSIKQWLSVSKIPVYVCKEIFFCEWIWQILGAMAFDCKPREISDAAIHVPFQGECPIDCADFDFIIKAPYLLHCIA